MRVLVTGGTGFVGRVVPFRLPMEYEGALLNSYGAHCDDSRARQEFGVLPRPLEETYRDTVRWLYHGGHITARQAGAVLELAVPHSER